jgi:hypothetical protein
MPGFAVPCVITDDIWHDVAREVNGLVFDRVRLIRHLPEGVKDSSLKSDLEAWRAEQIDERRA